MLPRGHCHLRAIQKRRRLTHILIGDTHLIPYLISFDYLCLDFPLVPKPYVRKVLIANLHFFAPSHVQLALESSKEDAPFKKLVMPRKEKGKGIATKSGELDAEREWSLARQGISLRSRLADQC